MSALDSNAQRELILNGHRFSGFAAVDNPIEYERPGDFIDVERGQDGTLYAMTNPGNVFGAMLTIRLHHRSASIGTFCQKEVNAFLQAESEGSAHTIYNGTETNLATGEVTRLNGGLLKSAPVKAEPNKVYEIVFEIEEAITVPESVPGVPAPANQG